VGSRKLELALTSVENQSADRRIRYSNLRRQVPRRHQFFAGIDACGWDFGIGTELTGEQVFRGGQLRNAFAGCGLQTSEGHILKAHRDDAQA